MASKDPIEIYRGESRSLMFAMTPATTITGWTLLFSVKKARVPMYEADGVIVDDATGTFRFALSAEDTADIPVGIYQYDVWRMDPGFERVLAVGVFSVRDVARL